MSIASSASGLYSSVKTGRSTTRSPPSATRRASGTADHAEPHATRKLREQLCEARAQDAEHVTTRGDGRDDDVDALELFEESGHIEQGSLDVGRTLDAVRVATERATDTTV